MTMITSTLVLLADGETGNDTLPRPERAADTASAAEAATIIQGGATAILHGTAADAIEVLLLLGCDRQWAAARVRYTTRRTTLRRPKPARPKKAFPSPPDRSAHTKHIAWMRVTHNGRRDREQMAPHEREEYDSLGVRRLCPPPEPMTHQQQSEAKRRYREACDDDFDTSRPTPTPPRLSPQRPSPHLNQLAHQDHQGPVSL